MAIKQDWRNWRNERSSTTGDDRQSSAWDGDYTTITVQKPFCAPARGKILTALQPRGIIVGDADIDERTVATTPKDIAERMKIEFRTFENLKYAGIGLIQYLPMAIEADIKVRSSQAAWAEYCLAASGHFVIVKGVNRKMTKAGYRRNGNLPTTTNGKETIAYVKGKLGEKFQPMIEPECSKGKKQWISFMKEANKAKGKRK